MSTLSDVFKYISHFRHAGHQVGRKVGDMLEVLTYAAIVKEQDLHARLCVEPKVFGFSDAGHKVEFTLLRKPSFDDAGQPLIRNGGEIRDPADMFAFIECKKVGVEQTVNGTFKKRYRKATARSYAIPYGEVVSVGFAPRGQVPHRFSVVVNDDKHVTVTDGDGELLIEDEVEAGSRIVFALSANQESHVFDNSMSLRDFPDTLASCRILEFVSIEDDHYCALLNDCLAGPQTPEKAKQSAFVALDVRKKRFNSFDKRADESDLISVLVLTEFSHWEQKSQNMISACIDKNFVVSDDLIVEAFVRFESLFGESFYDRVTKEQFENNQEVRQLVIELVNEHDGRIFSDIDDGSVRAFAFRDDELVFAS